MRFAAIYLRCKMWLTSSSDRIRHSNHVIDNNVASSQIEWYDKENMTLSLLLLQKKHQWKCLLRCVCDVYCMFCLDMSMGIRYSVSNTETGGSCDLYVESNATSWSQIPTKLRVVRAELSIASFTNGSATAMGLLFLLLNILKYYRWHGKCKEPSHFTRQVQRKGQHQFLLHLYHQEQTV